MVAQILRDNHGIQEFDQDSLFDVDPIGEIVLPMVTFALQRYHSLKQGKAFHARTILICGYNPHLSRLLKATEKLINSDKQVSKKLRFHFIQQRDPELDKHLNQAADIKPSDWKSTKLVSSVADDSFLKDLPDEFQNHYNSDM